MTPVPPLIHRRPKYAAKPPKQRDYRDEADACYMRLCLLQARRRRPSLPPGDLARNLYLHLSVYHPYIPYNPFLNWIQLADEALARCK